MSTFTFLDGLILAVAAIAMVMIVLVGLMFILMGFKYLNNSNEKIENKQTLSPKVKQTEAKTELTINKKLANVAALTALIMANEDNQDKNYKVTNVKRVK